MNIKPFLLSLCGAAVLQSGVAASADIFSGLNFTATDDMFVDNGSPKSNFGDQETILVKSNHSGDSRKTAVLKFAVNKGALTPDAYDASLLLDVADVGDKNSHDLALFLVNESCSAAINEDTTRYNDVYGLDKSSDGVDNGSSCIGNGGSALATFTVSPSDENKTVTVTSKALTQALNASGTGILTFYITQTENYDDPVRFASKEHASLLGPRLSTSIALNKSKLTQNGTETRVAYLGSSSYNLKGKLKIPVNKNQAIVMDGADVNMTFDANGKLVDLQGTSGLPKIPGWNLLANAPINSNLTEVEVSYGYPKAYDQYFDNHPLPLDKDKRYLFFRTSFGENLEFGSLFVRTPGQGSALVAVDPNGPTVLFYSDTPFIEMLDNFSVGFSGLDNLVYQPWVKGDVGQYMSSFYGDLYLGGSVDIPSEIPGVSVVVDGSSLVNADDSTFSFYSANNWMKQIGVNGQLDAKLGLADIVGLQFKVNESSLVFKRNWQDGSPGLAFAGKAEWDSINDMLKKISPYAPLLFAPVLGPAEYVEGQGKMSALLVADGQTGLTGDSFVSVYTKLGFSGPASFIGQPIEANVRISSSGNVSMKGTASFGGVKMPVSGIIDPYYTKFGGALKFNVNIDVASVQFQVGADFDTRNNEVKLKASGKACVDGLGCQAVWSPSASIAADGKVKVCAKIPFGIGNQCVTMK